MEITLSRFIAAVLAFIYLVVACIFGGIALLPIMLVILVPALCLIWFSEALGELTGFTVRMHTVDQKSPGFLVAAFGWLIIVGMPIWHIYEYFWK